MKGRVEFVKIENMEFGSGSGGDHDGSDPHRRKKRYHRHTAHQIQRLEAYEHCMLFIALHFCCFLIRFWNWVVFLVV